MLTIDELLRSKENQEIWSISPDDTVYAALEKMAEHNIGAMPVVKDCRLVGFFSERDYARKIILKGKCSLDTPIKDIMTEDPITVTPEQNLDDCMRLMAEHHIRHLPVVGETCLVGIVSMRDLVEAILNKQEVRIEKLEHYISGSEYQK